MFGAYANRGAEERSAPAHVPPICHRSAREFNNPLASDPSTAIKMPLGEVNGYDLRCRKTKRALLLAPPQG
jgi:hypothetical protein